MTLTYGSLFAGYGGLDMGVQSVLGGETAWFVEFDKHPSAILAHHWPDVPNLGDVTKVDWTQVEPVDVITGGSPCQDLSHAGKRAGMKASTRSGLWASMCDAIDIIRPRLVVWENVRGAFSAAADSAVEPCPLCVGDGRGVTLRALGRVLGDLAELGYDTRWYGLRAADVGAPHGRFRVFLFATPADSQGDEQREPFVGMGERAKPRRSDPSAGLTLLPTPAVNDMGEGKTVEHWDEWTATMQAKHGNGNGHCKSLAIEAQRLLPTPVSDNSRGLPSSSTDYASLANVAVEAQRLLPTPRTSDTNGAGVHGTGGPDLRTAVMVTLCAGCNVREPWEHRCEGPTCVCGECSEERRLFDEKCPTCGIAHHQAWGDYAAAIARWEHAIGRPAPAPTEPGPKGSPRLSPRFVEWMMGLPLGWVTGVDIPRNAQLKALGNGVVPQQSAAATRAFVEDITTDRASAGTP